MTATDDSLTLWLLRHAKAATDPPPGGTDHERPLAPRGRRDAAALGERLGTLGHPLPEAVLTSTATRTVQTAEAVTASLGVTLDRRGTLYYGSTPEDVLAELRSVPEGVGSVMVVGHNPTTHELAIDLVGGDELARVTLRAFPTCALAVYRLATARWEEVGAGLATLVGFYRPPY